MNKTIITGNLTKAPETRHTQGGTAICNLSVAVNDRVKKNDEWQDDTSFFDVVCFGKTAENCNNYLSKGSKVLIEGSLKQETWQERESGRNRSKVVIKALNIEFLNKVQKSEQGANTNAYNQNTGYQQQPQKRDMSADVPQAPNLAELKKSFEEPESEDLPF
jgi:single-strand DNA-binding protein